MTPLPPPPPPPLQWGSMATDDGKRFHCGNCEFGVLLTTTSTEERDKWLERAPLRLPISDDDIKELQYKPGRCCVMVGHYHLWDDTTITITSSSSTTTTHNRYHHPRFLAGPTAMSSCGHGHALFFPPAGDKPFTFGADFKLQSEAYHEARNAWLEQVMNGNGGGESSSSGGGGGGAANGGGGEFLLAYTQNLPFVDDDEEEEGEEQEDEEEDEEAED